MEFFAGIDRSYLFYRPLIRTRRQQTQRNRGRLCDLRLHLPKPAFAPAQPRYRSKVEHGTRLEASKFPASCRYT